MNKADARRLVRERKRLLNEADKKEAARLAFERVEQTSLFMQSRNILLYYSLPDELSTIEFINKWAAKKNIFLPRVNGDDLEILPYNKETLHVGAYQIEEPDGSDIRDICEMELVIVPAMAYDLSGNRVGRGKGYYDRLLVKADIAKIGVAYDFQLLDKIESEPHDVRVDIVITDKAVYNIES